MLRISLNTEHNDRNNMNQNPKPEHIDEQLISYLDGELPIDQEDAMFQSLATNEEDSRATMRELVTMRNVIPHDMEAFTPPINAKDEVFSRLGMTAQTNQQTSNWKKALLPLAFLALGLAGGYGIGNRFDGNERDELINMMRNHSTKDGIAPLRTIGVSPEVPEIILQQSAPVRVIYKDRVLNTASVTPLITLPPISVNQETKTVSVIDEKNDNNISNQVKTEEHIGKLIDQDNQTSIVETNSETKPIESIGGIVLSDNVQSNYPQFWMQFRNISTLQSPEFTGIREQLGILDNTRLTFAWSLGEHVAVGLEAGREPFVLNYHGMKEDRTYTFNQYAPMLTGGLFMQGRTSPLSYLGKSRFYAQAVAGGTEIGLLGRVGLGISYPISSKIGLQLGIEQSYSRFQFQGNWFDSQKLDLLYGISITL